MKVLVKVLVALVVWVTRRTRRASSTARGCAQTPARACASRCSGAARRRCAPRRCAAGLAAGAAPRRRAARRPGSRWRSGVILGALSKAGATYVPRLHLGVGVDESEGLGGERGGVVPHDAVGEARQPEGDRAVGAVARGGQRAVCLAEQRAIGWQAQWARGAWSVAGAWSGAGAWRGRLAW